MGEVGVGGTGGGGGARPELSAEGKPVTYN